jgi:glycine betaine/proline transport system substrate-binding protein
MRKATWSVVRLVGVAASATLVLAACGGGNINTTAGGSSQGSQTCTDKLDMAVNPWVGYEADAYVVGEIAQKKLGCQVAYHNLKEQISWAGFGTGAVDVVMENWGHDELAKKYMKSAGGNGTATDFGQTGNKGIIGWYVPPWLAKAHPDITNWQNLNKYASNFQTSESGNQGQFLDGDPSYVTNDEALINNLHLNFKVVYAGSENALIQAFRQAEQKHTWVIGYFYEPQWFLSEVPLVHVNLPKYTPGCDADPQKVACDYPVYHLNKVVSTKWANSGQPDVTLVKNFKWTNDDQNTVAEYIAKEGMDPAAAADKWIAANKDLVDQWLQGT